MKINKHTAIRALSGKTIEVTIERGTYSREVRLDGMPTGTYKTEVIDATTITLRDASGKVLASESEIRPLSCGKGLRNYSQAVKMGCKGMIGDHVFLSAETYDAIVSALAEANAAAPKTAEQVEIEDARAAAKKAYDEWYNSDEQRKAREFAREFEREDSDY
jgi:hypothetical protein